MLSSEHCQAVKECTKTAKETCQGISTEHKEVHAAISKFGRAIDKVCVSNSPIPPPLLLSSTSSLGQLKYTTLKCCSLARLYPSPYLLNSRISGAIQYSLASHTLRMREEGSGHAATIELSPWQKLDVTNQIHALHRPHPLSRSTITSKRIERMSASYYLTAMCDNCVPWQQLGSCSMARPFLSLRRVLLARLQ